MPQTERLRTQQLASDTDGNEVLTACNRQTPAELKKNNNNNHESAHTKNSTDKRRLAVSLTGLLLSAIPQTQANILPRPHPQPRISHDRKKNKTPRQFFSNDSFLRISNALERQLEV